MGKNIFFQNPSTCVKSVNSTNFMFFTEKLLLSHRKLFMKSIIILTTAQNHLMQNMYFPQTLLKRQKMLYFPSISVFGQPLLKLSLHISGQIRGFWASLNVGPTGKILKSLIYFHFHFHCLWDLFFIKNFVYNKTFIYLQW